MNALTPRQSEILDKIRDFIDREHYSPSVRDVAEMMGGCHPHAARGMLLRLERAGRIRRAIGWNGRYVQRSIVFIASPTQPPESMDGSYSYH